MHQKSFTLIFLPAILLTASCVSSKKYQQAVNDLSQARETNAQQAQRVAAYENEISQHKANYANLSKQLQESRNQSNSYADSLRSMRQVLVDQEANFRRIYTKVDSGLLNFQRAGVAVNYKNGLVYISMKNELIFTGGGTQIGWEGEQALSVVANVIREFPGVTAFILGNTDDQPAKGGFKDNWSASTERANAVVRVLRNKYSVDPARMISCGRSQFRPIGDNNTEDGRSVNRRIDVVLNPIMDMMWEGKIPGK